MRSRGSRAERSDTSPAEPGSMLLVQFLLVLERSQLRTRCADLLRCAFQGSAVRWLSRARTAASAFVADSRRRLCRRPGGGGRCCGLVASQELVFQIGCGGLEVALLRLLQLLLEVGLPLRSARGALEALQSRRQFVLEAVSRDQDDPARVCRRRRGFLHLVAVLAYATNFFDCLSAFVRSEDASISSTSPWLMSANPPAPRTRCCGRVPVRRADERPGH